MVKHTQTIRRQFVEELTDITSKYLLRNSAVHWLIIEMCFSQNHRKMGKSEKILLQFVTKAKKVQRDM